MRFRPGSKGSLITKLSALSVVVLVIPWLGFQAMSAMKTFLIEGQQQAQMMTAAGAAALLSRRPELFGDFSGAGGDDTLPLPLYPSRGLKVVDGYQDDWQPLQDFRLRFGGGDQGHGFYVVMSEQGEYLYMMVNVDDRSLVTRNPGVRQLDRNDHLRIYLPSAQGHSRRLVLAFEGNGIARAYQVDSQWRYPLSGGVEDRVQAQVSLRPSGYDLEFRLPLGWLTEKKRLGIAVVDVGAENGGEIVAISETVSGVSDGHSNPVTARSPEVENILQEFSGDNTRLWLVDSHRRVRAIVGLLQPELTGLYPEASEEPLPDFFSLLYRRVTGILVGANNGGFEDFDADRVHTRNDDIYRRALAGAKVTAVRESLDGSVDIVTAAAPIVSGSENVGVLLLEKTTDDILQLQRQGLEALIVLTVAAVVLVAGLLLAFAFRLVWRIRRLGMDAGASVEASGRLVPDNTPIREAAAADEVGDLARTIQRMLDRLEQHQGFLKNIPRTLRHEINNPVNTIGTALDRLEQGGEKQREVYVHSARRGLARINQVISALAEAASLEEALKRGETESLDLGALVSLYVSYQSGRDGLDVAVEVPSAPVQIHASGEHIEAMLDKLLDNARDFACPPSEKAKATIFVTLETEKEQAVLSVANLGPTIETDRLPGLFRLMESRREKRIEGHFGLGLYVVRVIVEHHGGTVFAENLKDESGVVFRVILPLAQ